MFRVWLFTLAFCLILGLSAEKEADKVIDPKWIKPGALDRWTQKQQMREQTDNACDSVPPLECPKCPPVEANSAECKPTDEEQQLALVFYRKLVKTLFASNILQLDPSGSYYENELTLKITPRQLNKLTADLDAPRTIDAIVSEIFEQSASLRRRILQKENRCERLYVFLQGIMESVFLQAVLPILLVIAGCCVLRVVSSFTRIHPFLLFLLLILCFTVTNKWRECNAKLQKQVLEDMHRGISTEAASTMCDPLQVLVESSVTVQATYFKALFKEFLHTYNESTKGLGFWHSMLIGALLLGFAYILVSTILQVGIHSGFQVAGNIVIAGLFGPRTNAAIENQPIDYNNQQPQIANPPQIPALNINIQLGDAVASARQSRTELLRAESERIEEIVDEPTVEAIESGHDTERESNAKDAEEKPGASIEVKPEAIIVTEVNDDSKTNSHPDGRET
uniref:Chloride channel CLIC-like protein 1 n=1 Tax=Anopheles darlingi TaxID=43151 RepID=A0A2M4DG92_ANODA